MKNLKFVLAFFILSLFLFIPRLIATFSFDALEDEILAIGTNLEITSPIILMNAPDTTHPGLWYALMSLPTQLLNINHGILPYRIMHVSLFSFGIVGCICYFYKKLPTTFLSSLFLLLASNAFIIHLTFQHRMYSLVLVLTFLYSLLWYEMVYFKKNITISLKKNALLALIAAAMFFTNYSSIWILPFWPALYLFYNRADKKSLLTLLNFASIFVLLTAWFYEKFFNNIGTSVEINQWAPSLSLHTIQNVIANYFGFLPDYNQIPTLNTPLAFIGISFIITFWYYRRQESFSILYLGLLVVFALYVFAAYLTGNSLLYGRTSITFIFILYFLFAHLVKLSNWGSLAFIGAVFFIQVTLAFYYFLSLRTNREYDFFLNIPTNYVNSVVRSYNLADLPPDTCIISLPYWNTTALSFFLGSSSREILTLQPKYQDKREACKHAVLVLQSSIPYEHPFARADFDYLYTHFPTRKMLVEIGNQQLFQLF